jgi:flagellar biosynthetic protein FliQ
MTPESVITIGREALELATVLMLILILPALLTGLLVSLFQAATQINEATLSFVPKLLVTLAVLILAGPWLLNMMTDYVTRLFDRIPTLIG